MNPPNHGRSRRGVASRQTSRSSTFYRTLGYVLVGFSVYLFAHAAYDQGRGISAPPLIPGSYTPYNRPVERRDTDPEMFHALMIYEWACPIAFLIGGFVILGIVRRANRCDPFSPEYTGSSALDECERTLDAELRKKHSPLR